MTTQVELSSEVEARLAADAVVRGMALAQYAGKLLTEAASNAGGSGRLTRDDFHAMREEFSRGSEKLPVLPPEATERASFCEVRW